MRVDLDHGEIRRLMHGHEIQADMDRRGENVRAEAARRAASVAKPSEWADAMATEPGRDADGVYVDVSWRQGTGSGESWKGHLFEFGTPTRLATPALRPALDAAGRD